MDYPSTEWVEELAASLRAVAGVDRIPFVLQYEVGEFVHHVIIGATNDAAVGPHRSPNVVFATDEGTASAIGSGTLSAQAAFMHGDLQVRGEITELIDRLDVLQAFDHR